MIYFLTATLALIFVINLYINDKAFCAPSVIFSLSFLFSSIWACIYKNKWNLDISFKTYCLVILFVILFSMACFIEDNFSYRNNIQTKQCQEEINIISLNKLSVVVFFIIEVLVTILYSRQIKSITGLNDMSKAIGSIYRDSSQLNLPSYMRILISMTRALGYWMSYIFTITLLKTKNINITALLMLITSILSSAFTGSRGNAVCILLSIPGYWLLLEYKGNPHRRSFKVKNIVLAIALIIGGLWGFSQAQEWLGRSVNIKPMDLIATYCGSEIYNLDYYLKNFRVPTNTGTWGASCFNSIEQTFSRYFDLNFTEPSYSHPDLFSNGYYLGNVYTTIYEPIFDFGYIGAAIFIVIYGIVIQFIFNKALKSPNDENAPIMMILYGYIFPVLVVSFFGWWFGNYIISTSFIYTLITWILCRFLFFRIKFKIGNTIL